MDEILPGLYLGDASDANDIAFAGELLCVLEQGTTNPGRTRFWVPILQPRSDSPFGFYAVRERLDLTAVVVEAVRKSGRNILVHCGAGVERSPLTVVWYLVRHGHFSTLDAAYEFLKGKRPRVEDRQIWLEPLKG
jgi:protein-tyrosine phosphatase